LGQFDCPILNWFLLINARHLTEDLPTLIFRSEASSPAMGQFPVGVGLISARKIVAERHFWPLTGGVSAVARIGGKEHPFGFLDEPISGSMRVGLFEFQRLDVSSSAVFQVAWWRAVRFTAQLSSQGFQR